MDNWSAGEVGGVFAGVVAVAASVGKGLAWLLNWQGERSERRSKRLDAWQKSLDQREREYRETLERDLGEMREKLSSMQGEMLRLRSQQGALSFSLLEVAVAHRDKDPESPALTRAAVALRQAFPPEYDHPPEIAELIRALEFKLREDASRR